MFLAESSAAARDADPIRSVPAAESVLRPPPEADQGTTAGHGDRRRHRMKSCSLPIRYGGIRFKTATSQRINVAYNTPAARTRQQPTRSAGRCREVRRGCELTARSIAPWVSTPTAAAPPVKFPKGDRGRSHPQDRHRAGSIETRRLPCALAGVRLSDPSLDRRPQGCLCHRDLGPLPRRLPIRGRQRL